MTQKYPAPWTLDGSGFILLYKFPRSMAGSRFFTAHGAKDEKFGGFGTVMLADYARSTAGPYSELLFTPGKFSFEEEKAHSISKIYVSTMESVVNGRENWGIPKELADFTFEDGADGTMLVIVRKDDRTIFRAGFETLGPRFPFSTSVFPLPLAQLHQGRLLRTDFSGRGRARLASLRSMEVDREYFPDIARLKPLAALHVEGFRIVFPEARVLKAS